MRSFRIAAVIFVWMMAGAVAGQCLTAQRTVASTHSILPGPIAWSGRSVAVAGRETTNGSVFVAAFDGAAQPLGPVTIVPDSEDSEVLGLVWNGSEFMLFFKNAEHRLILRRVSAEGRLVGSAIQRYRLDLAEEDRVEIIWSAFHGRYVIARTSSGIRPGVWLTSLDRDGSLEHNVQIDDEAADGPIHIAETATGTIGIFYPDTRGGYVRYQPAVPSRLTGASKRVWRDAENLMVAAAGSEFVLLRTADINSIRRALEWKFIDTAGNDVIGERRVAQFSNVADAGAVAFEVTGDDEFAIAYRDLVGGSTDLEVRLRRVDRAGNVLSDTVFGDGSRYESDLAMENFIFNGMSFVTVAGVDTATADRAIILSWCALRVNIDAPRTVRPGDTVTFSAIVEGGVPRFRYFWEGFGRQSDQRTFEHTFLQPGTYTVALTVVDETATRVSTTFTVDVVEDVVSAPARRRTVRK